MSEILNDIHIVQFDVHIFLLGVFVGVYLAMVPFLWDQRQRQREKTR